MNMLQYQRPNNPLKLLDDYLSSISSSTSTNIQGATADFCVDNDDSDTIINDATAVANATITSSSSSPEKQSTQIAQEQQQQQQQQEEHLHNSVLRAASELFGNNISLLENSLALLEE